MSVTQHSDHTQCPRYEALHLKTHSQACHTTQSSRAITLPGNKDPPFNQIT